MRAWATFVMTMAALAAPAVESRAAEIKVDTPPPNMAWNVDWLENVCTLRRGYGDAAAPDVIWIEQISPASPIELTIISDKLKSTRDMFPIFLTWGTHPSRQVPQIMRGTTQSGRTALFFGPRTLRYHAPGEQDVVRWTYTDQAENVAGITQLAVQIGHAQVVFGLGPFPKALAALRTCSENLIKQAGLDPVEQANLASLPQPISPPNSWLGGGDYPLAQGFKGTEAIVRFRLMVDASGQPSSCRVMRSINEKVFGEVSCAKLMKRARFLPARNTQGQAVPSFFASSVRFVIGR